MEYIHCLEQCVKHSKCHVSVSCIHLFRPVSTGDQVLFQELGNTMLNRKPK